jgi:hypothetical protein
MGNSIGGRRKGAKVMQLDGTAFRVKPPASAGTVLRDHPGFQLLESEEVKLLGVRARPLAHDAQLRPGRLYFLVALPRPAAPPRRAWSGALHVGARERLESLMLTRRSTSDLSLAASAGTGTGTAPPSPLSTASEGGGPVRLRMRLPKAEVDRLMAESRDAADAAARIMQLCAAATPDRTPRFVPTPDWGAGAAAFPQTPDRSPRFAATPDWGTGFMMPPGAAAAPTTPERWPALPRTPEYASPGVKASRKEVTHSATASIPPRRLLQFLDSTGISPFASVLIFLKNKFIIMRKKRCQCIRTCSSQPRASKFYLIDLQFIDVDINKPTNHKSQWVFLGSVGNDEVGKILKKQNTAAVEKSMFSLLSNSQMVPYVLCVEYRLCK